MNSFHYLSFHLMLVATDQCHYFLGSFQFQHRNYFILSHLFCFVLPTLYGHYAWNSAWIGYFYFGVVRWILLLHSTWCVNSVAHMWGSTPYNPKISSRQSALTSIVAVGEGWHNYHHTYPYDYRASEFNWNNEWNPTTLLLDSLSSVGLVWNKKSRQSH